MFTQKTLENAFKSEWATGGDDFNKTSIWHISIHVKKSNLLG